MSCSLLLLLAFADRPRTLHLSFHLQRLCYIKKENTHTDECAMKLKYPFLKEERRRNKDNGVIRSEGFGQFKRSPHLVDSADKEAVKVPFREIDKYTHALISRGTKQIN